jgi:phytoene dehydrogenase-like protein
VNLDKVYFNERCGAHAFYTPTTVGLSSLASWEEITGSPADLYDWVGKVLEHTTYEISCPVLRDDTLAPEGKTGVIVSTLMDYRLVRKFSEEGVYDAFKDFCIRKIADVLSRSIFPGIVENTEFAICGTPLTIEKETGNSEGAITGWAFTNEQMPAVNNFKKIAASIKTPIEDVFQCGQWTFSPSGLPVSILTGKLAADAVRKKLKGRDL